MALVFRLNNEPVNESKAKPTALPLTELNQIKKVKATDDADEDAWLALERNKTDLRSSGFAIQLDCE